MSEWKHYPFLSAIIACNKKAMTKNFTCNYLRNIFVLSYWSSCSSAYLHIDYTIAKIRNLSNDLDWHNIFRLLYYSCKSYLVRFLFWEVFAVFFDCCNLRIAVHTLLCLYALSGLLYPFDGMWAWHMFFTEVIMTVCVWSFKIQARMKAKIGI